MTDRSDGRNGVRRDVPRFNLVDVFAGVGGLTLGFAACGSDPAFEFVPRLMVDIDPDARSVAQRNLSTTSYLQADIHDLSGPEIRARAGLEPKEEIHVLVGGPPCQGFSWLGKRALDDARNVHVLDFLRLVRELRPLVVVMENVPLIVTSHQGQIIQEISQNLAGLGYANCADILVASDYGVPQLRKRAFVVGYRHDLGVAPEFPARTHERVAFAAEIVHADDRVRFEADKVPYISVEEAIGDLPPVKAGEGDEVMFYTTEPVTDYQRWARTGSVAIFNHRPRAHSAAYLRKISVIGEGGRNQELPAGKRFSDNYYSQAYARLHRQGIAQTITTSFGNPGSGRFMHYRDLRSLTVREAARLQSFPDWFAFEGPQHVQMRHVGNAVPPLLARALRDRIGRDLLAIGAERPTERQKASTTEVSEERSRVMRAVTSKDSGAEKAIRKHLRLLGLRGYRLHSSAVPGRPDVLFPRERIAIFVDGCFWHGCPRCYRAPKARAEYWRMKVTRNKQRDARVTEECKASGWRVLRFWEHEVLEAPARIAKKISRSVKSRAAKRA